MHLHPEAHVQLLQHCVTLVPTKKQRGADHFYGHIFQEKKNEHKDPCQGLWFYEKMQRRRRRLHPPPSSYTSSTPCLLSHTPLRYPKVNGHACGVSTTPRKRRRRVLQGEGEHVPSLSCDPLFFSSVPHISFLLYCPSPLTARMDAYIVLCALFPVS